MTDRLIVPLLALLAALVVAGSTLASSWGPWILLCGGWALALILHRPVTALVLTLLLLPLSPALPGTLVSRLTDYGLPALALLLLLAGRHLVGRRVEMPSGKLFIWFLLFLIWTLFTGLLSRFPQAGIVQGLRIGVMAVTLVACWNLFTRRSLAATLLTLALIIVPLAGFGVWQVVSRGVTEVLYARLLTPDRLSAIYVNPNTFGTVIAHAMAILTPFVLVRLGRRQVQQPVRSST